VITMFCQHCGQGVHQQAVVCTSCGCAVQKAKTWSAFGLLIVLTILFPIIGVILGVIGLAQGKEKSGTLLVTGLVAWIIWIAILL